MKIKRIDSTVVVEVEQTGEYGQESVQQVINKLASRGFAYHSLLATAIHGNEVKIHYTRYLDLEL